MMHKVELNENKNEHNKELDNIEHREVIENHLGEWDNNMECKEELDNDKDHEEEQINNLEHKEELDGKIDQEALDKNVEHKNQIPNSNANWVNNIEHMEKLNNEMKQSKCDGPFEEKETSASWKMNELLPDGWRMKTDDGNKVVFMSREGHLFCSAEEVLDFMSESDDYSNYDMNTVTVLFEEIAEQRNGVNLLEELAVDNDQVNNYTGVVVDQPENGKVDGESVVNNYDQISAFMSEDSADDSDDEDNL